jgi:hypothetical protein
MTYYQSFDRPKNATKMKVMLQIMVNFPINLQLLHVSFNFAKQIVLSFNKHFIAFIVYAIIFIETFTRKLL